MNGFGGVKDNLFSCFSAGTRLLLGLSKAWHIPGKKSGGFTYLQASHHLSIRKMVNLGFNSPNSDMKNNKKKNQDNFVHSIQNFFLYITFSLETNFPE